MISQRVCSKNSSWMRITVLHRIYLSTRHVPGASIKYSSKVRTTKIFSLAACFLGALRKKPTRIRARMSSPTLTRALQQTNMYKIVENGQHTVQSSSSLPKTTTMATNHASGVEQKCVDSLAPLALSRAKDLNDHQPRTKYRCRNRHTRCETTSSRYSMRDRSRPRSREGPRCHSI